MALSAFSETAGETQRDGKKKRGYELVNLFPADLAAVVPAVVSSGIAHKIGATQERKARWSTSYR